MLPNSDFEVPNDDVVLPNEGVVLPNDDVELIYLAIAARLIRPDGHVAWVGDGTSRGLAEAVTTWF